MSINLKTAADIITDAARTLGIVSADISDPYASSNASVLLLTSLLNEAGRELVQEAEWQLLTVHTGSITTVNGTASYALPTSPIFDRLVEGTLWDQTEDLPGLPISARQYQALLARSDSPASSFLYLLNGTKLYVYPTPTSTRSLAFSYVTAYWAGGTTEPTADEATAASDKIWFDRKLITSLLKLKFLNASGLPSTAAQLDYDRALANAKSSDGTAPTLHLAGPRVPRVYDPLPVDTLDAT